MNSLVAQYRDYYKKQNGFDDKRTDPEITLSLGAKAVASKTLDQQPEDFVKEFQEYSDDIAPTAGEELTTSLERSTRGLGGTALGGLGLAADWLPGEVTDPYIRDPLLKKAAELQEPELGEPPPLTMDDVHSVKSAIRYGASQVGAAAPSIAESLLVGLGSAALGTAVEPGGGTVAGGVAGVVGKEAVKAALKSEVRRRILMAAPIVANSALLSSGELYNNFFNDPNISKDDARNYATGLGVLAAIPDTFLPGYVAGKFVKPAKDAVENEARKTFLKTLAKEAVKVMPLEGGTEAYQEWIGIVGQRLAAHKDDPYNLTTADWKQMREAAVGGAVGGGLAAPIAAFGETRHSAPAPTAEEGGDETEVPPGTPPATPATPTPPRGRPPAPVTTATAAPVTSRVALLSKEDQRGRYDSLKHIELGRTLTADETEEKRVLEILNMGQPGFARQTTPAATTTTLPSAAPAPAPTPVVTSTAPVVAAAPVTQDEAPAPVARPLVPPTPLPVVKPFSAEYANQLAQAAVNKIRALIDVEGDTRAAADMLRDFIAAPTREKMDAITAEIAKQQAAANLQNLAVETGAASSLSARAKELAKQAQKDFRQRQMDEQSANADAMKVNLEAADKPPVTSPVEILAPPAPGPVAEGTAPLAFGRLIAPPVNFTLKGDEWTDLAKDPSTMEAAISEALGFDQAKSAPGEGARKNKTNASQTSFGIALLDPLTGKVHQRGILRPTVETLTTKPNEFRLGLAVQNMGTTRQEGKATKGATVPKFNQVTASGTKTALLSDVINAGLIPLTRVNFENSGRIAQDFNSQAEFYASLNATPLTDLAANRNAAKVAAEAAADAATVAAATTPAELAAAAKTIEKKQAKKAKKGDALAAPLVEQAEVNLDDKSNPLLAKIGDSGKPTPAPIEVLSDDGPGPWHIDHMPHGGKDWTRLMTYTTQPKGGVRAAFDKRSGAKTADGIYRLKNGRGNDLATVFTPTRTGKAAVVMEPADHDEMSRAYDFLSETAELTDRMGQPTGKRSPDYLAALHAQWLKADTDAKRAVLLKQFLLGLKDSTFEGNRLGFLYSDFIGPRRAALVLNDVLKNYAQLKSESDDDTGGRSGTPAIREGATPPRGHGDQAERGRAKGAGVVSPSVATEGGGTDNAAADSAPRAPARAESAPPNQSVAQRVAAKTAGSGAWTKRFLGLYQEITEHGGKFSDQLIDLFTTKTKNLFRQLAADTSDTLEGFYAHVQDSYDKSKSGEAFAKRMRGETAEKPMTEEQRREADPAYDKAQQAVEDALVDPESTRGTMVKLARKFNKAGLIDDRHMAEIERIGKDRDMGPEDVGSEVKSALEYTANQIDKSTERATTVSDAERYTEIVAQMKQLVADGKVDSPEYQELFAEREEIKNRNQEGADNIPTEATFDARTPPHERTGGAMVENTLMPTTGRIESPEVLPDSVAAAKYNSDEARRRGSQENLDESAPVNQEWAPTRNEEEAVTARLREIAQKLTSENPKGTPPVRIESVEHLGQRLPGRGSVDFAQATRLIGKVFGKNIIFARITGGNRDRAFRGLYDRGSNIVVNVAGNVSMLKVVGHELTHAMAEQQPKLFDALWEYINGVSPMPEEYLKESQALGYTDRKAQVEWVADVVGENFGERSFWTEMRTAIESKATTPEQKSAVQNLAAFVGGWVRRIYMQMRRLLGTDSIAVKEIAGMQKKVADFMAEYAATAPYATQLQGEVEDIDLSTTRAAEYDEAKANIDSAAWNSLLPHIKQAQQASGLEPDAHWKMVSRREHPTAILEANEKRARGSINAQFTDEKFTPSMRSRSVSTAHKLALSLERKARQYAASAGEAIKKHTSELEDLVKRYTKSEREYMDADLVQSNLFKGLQDILAGVAKDVESVGDAAELHGELTGAVREMEGLSNDEVIPEDYQKVFKNILSSDNVSIYGKLEALSKLNLPLRGMKAVDIVAAMKNSGDKTLIDLAETNRPLAVALSVLARNRIKEMDLMQLRLMTDKKKAVAIKQQLEDLRTASDERIEQMWPALSEARSSQSLSARLEAAYVSDRRKLKRAQNALARAAKKERITQDFADRIGQHREELGKESGDYGTWVPADGAMYTSMSRNKDGEWVSTQKKMHMAGPEVTAQYGELAKDLAENTRWLRTHPNQEGTKLHNTVKLQTEELLNMDISRKHAAAGRFLLDKILSPFAEKFSRMGGLGGKNIAAMFQRFQYITRNGPYHDELTAKAKQWEHALKNVTKAAGYKAPMEFMRDVNDHVMYQIEQNPGKDEEGVIRDAVRTARRLLPSDNIVAPDFAVRLAEYLRKSKAVSERLAAIARENGVHIQDGTVNNLMRNAIKQGWLTVPRTLNRPVIEHLVSVMKAAGWKRNLFSDLNDEESDVPLGDRIKEATDQYFTPEIVTKFVEPFVNKPGKDVFFGAERTGEDSWSHLTQFEAQAAWEQSDGNVLTFIDKLFDETYEPASENSNREDDKNAYRLAMLHRFNVLYAIEDSLNSKFNRDAKNDRESLPHRMMDGRTNDLIPPEHFKYDWFDQGSTNTALTEIGYHAAFGRDSTKLHQAINALNRDLEINVSKYDQLRGVTTAAKQREATAKGWNWNDLKRAKGDHADAKDLVKDLKTQFGGRSGNKNEAILDFLRLNAALVLNQPTSGLWNVPSIFDFPSVIGAGKMGLSSVGRTAKHLVKGVLGSPLAAANINIFRASNHYRAIAKNMQDHQQSLTREERLTDIGRRGQYSEGGVGNRTTQVSRFVTNLLKLSLGNKHGHIAFNALHAPFTYLSQQVAVAIAAANVENFETLIKNTQKFFDEHPEAANNPAYKVTAADLKMKGPAYFTDERAFDYYRSKAYEYGLGSIEDIARAATEKGTNEVMTKDQVLKVAQMAMNEISLESSINSRPAGWEKNPILKYGGLLLGWPASKTHQINKSLKTADGQKTAASVMRGVGTMAAWSLPLALAYSFLMDKWDEDIVGKRSARRDIDKRAGIPLIGPILAATTGDRKLSNIAGMLERGAKSGMYGLGGDFGNSMVNTLDPKSGQRDFSLDSRVLAFSQWANIRDMMRNYLAQDRTYTWDSVGRPLFSALGGNGLLQAQQMVNNAAHLDNDERWIAERTSVGNYLRNAGREAGIELRSGGARTTPTPVTVWEREMYLAALANDRGKFLDAYRAALAASRNRGDEDPEGQVLASWKARGPLAVFGHKLTDAEERKLMRTLDDKGRGLVRSAIHNYDHFSSLIEPSGLQRAMKRDMNSAMRGMKPPTLEDVRRRAMSFR